MAVRVADTLKQANDNKDFPVVEGDVVQVTISDSKMYLQDAIDNNLIGGGSDTSIKVISEEDYNALVEADTIDPNVLYAITDSTYSASASGDASIDDTITSKVNVWSSSKVSGELENKLNKTGDTMTGELVLRTVSGLDSPELVASGVLALNEQTIDTAIEILRYTSGCMGSIDLTSEYTFGSTTIPAGWYNYIWIPHRTGGKYGETNGDNCNYGTLKLFGMTSDYGEFSIRFSSGNVASASSVGGVQEISVSAYEALTDKSGVYYVYQD